MRQRQQARPSSVRVKTPGVRLKSCKPVLSSSLQLQADGRWSGAQVAARETVPSRATVMKQRKAWIRGRSFI